MRRLLCAFLCVLCLCAVVHAQESETIVDTAPLEEALPDGLTIGEVSGTEGFWERLTGLVTDALQRNTDSYQKALRLCALLLCVVLLCALLQQSSLHAGERAVPATGALGLCALCMSSFPALITLAAETVEKMTDYAAVSMPVLATAVAMQGTMSSAEALYAGTILFAQLLMQLISRILIPMVYFYLAVAAAEAAIGTQMLGALRDFIGWLISGSLRLVVYAFLAYMSLTGVISGSSDAAAIKATKVAVSGMVPVVGGVISDASETLLAGAGVLKNTVGMFGMLAVLGICIVPFLRLGMHYLLLKLTAAVSAAVGLKPHVRLLRDFSTAMGYLLAMCGACALLLLIASICFLRVVV